MSRVAPAFIAPLTLEKFYAEYWEKQPLHISRSDSKSTRLVDFGTIEALLANQPLYFPGVQLTQTGKSIELGSYADAQNRILPLRLFEHHNNGATIVLSQAHILFSPLNDLCREVMRTMKMRCQTNVYVSPPGNQGFNAHYDTHDVFILQISGSKTFNFYPSSVDLPFPDEGFDASKLEPAEVDESVMLTAGDTLYIPRGVVHDAVADEHEPSIHVTLGVYPVLARDLLQEAVQLVAERDPRLRKSLDSICGIPDENTSESISSAMEDMMKEVLSLVKKPEIVKELQDRFSDELSLSALQNCHGLSLRKNGLDGGVVRLQGRSVIRLRREMVIDYECWPNGVKIRSFGQIVEFTTPISRFVSQLLSEGELSAEVVTELTSDQRDAMVERLLQENLIEVI